MPTSTLHSATSLARSRSAASLSRKSSRHKAFASGVHPVANGARKRLTSPSPAVAQLPVRRRRQSNAIPRRRATSPSPVRAGGRGVRRQSPTAVLAREARRRKSPLARSHSTGSIARTASMRRSAVGASSIASKRAQKKARAAAARRLARSKSVNSIARKRAIAAANAKSISSARTRSQYHIQPMALGGEPTTGPIGARPAGGVGGLFRRKSNPADKRPALRGGLGGLFGKKTPSPAVIIAPTPGGHQRPALTLGGGGGGALDKTLVPRAAQTMALVPRETAVVPRRATGRPLTLAERKRAMALATRNANTRRLRTVRYGASGANGTMMMRRAVMGSGGGVRVGPMPAGFPGVNGGSTSIGMRSVLLDGEDIGGYEGNYGGMGPTGFEAVKLALIHYKLNQVDVCAIVDDRTVEEWEETSLAESAEAIAQLRTEGMLLVPPSGSDYKRFLLKIASELDMDIVSNNQFEIEQELEEEPMEFLDTKLIPYMFVKETFIPHPEEGRILTGLHGPRPIDPMLLTGASGGATIEPFNVRRLKQLPGKSGGGGGGGNGPVMGLPRGAKPSGGQAVVPLKLRSGQRVAAVRAAAAATRNRKVYQSRMRSITQQQQMAQRRRQLTQMQKLSQQPGVLRLTR